jgi:hypothetical protein
MPPSRTVGGDVLAALRRERGEQVSVDDRLVVAHGRRRARSCSIQRRYSAAAQAKVAPVRTMPGSVPRRAWSRTSLSRAAAVRLVS